MQKLSFTCEKGEFSVNFLESGEWHPLPVGFGQAKESWLTLHEESYLVGTCGEFTTDENGTAVLKLEITFLEDACAEKSIFSSCQRMNFRFAGTKLREKA